MTVKTKIRWFLIKIAVQVYRLVPQRVRKRLVNGGVPILLYHEIEPDVFEQHLRYLQSHYTIIPLARFKEALYYKSAASLPNDALIITFDDGWKSNYRLLSVLLRNNVPVTIFLLAGLVGTRRKIWNYTIERKGREESLNSRLKNLTNSEKDRLLYEKNGYYPTREYKTRVMLSYNEIERMKPIVDFQSHGMFHPVFPMCSESELHAEMQESRDKLRTIFGIECDALAFPYGRYGRRECEMASQCGYKIARVANRPGINKLGSHPYKLRSIGIGESWGEVQLRRAIMWSEIISVKENLLLRASHTWR